MKARKSTESLKEWQTSGKNVNCDKISRKSFPCDDKRKFPNTDDCEAKRMSFVDFCEMGGV